MGCSMEIGALRQPIRLQSKVAEIYCANLTRRLVERACP